MLCAFFAKTRYRGKMIGTSLPKNDGVWFSLIFAELLAVAVTAFFLVKLKKNIKRAVTL